MKITKRQLIQVIREEAQKDQNNDNKNDFADVKIARMKASGMSDEEIRKKHPELFEGQNKTVMRESEIRAIIRTELKESLWKNVRNKRKQGRPPAKPGEEGYPDEKAWQAAQETDETDKEVLDELDEIDCWDGYSPGAQTGVKTKKGKGGERVNNCEKIKEDESLEEAIDYHISASVGVDKNIFRPGSRNFFKLFNEVRYLYQLGLYEARSEDELELLESDIGKFVKIGGDIVPLDFPMLESREYLLEAEYQGRKVELNKPKRGEGGKGYVYVNSGKKTKDGKIKVKKVTFGSSMPDAMGDSDAAKKRRKNFGDRHNCSDKDDKTKAGYWSCRATKFFGRDIPGWW